MKRAISGLVGVVGASMLVVLASPDVRSETPPAAAPSPDRDPTGGSGPVLPARDPELDAAAQAIASDRVLDGAQVGIAVLDVDTGKLLAAVNEHLALDPGSDAKLYTAAAALATLHGEHRYETTLTGRLDGDTVSGSLGLRGPGDPSLTTADLWDMVQELKAFGVKRVDGDVVVEQRFYDDQTTPPNFEQPPNEWAPFRAPLSAVAVDENCITMTVRPASPGAPARVDFDPPGFVDVDGGIKTADAGGADTVELSLAPSVPTTRPRMVAHLSGAIAADSRVVRITRRAQDPRLLAGYALKALLEKAEVKVSGDVKLGTARGHTLAKHLSAPLSQLLYALGKESDSFSAEMIFRTLDAKEGGEGHGRASNGGDTGEPLASFLGRVGASDTGLALKNGSGLFDADRATAWSTVELLRWAYRDPQIQPEFLAQLSVGGVDGTLEKRFRREATRRHVRAKTGTLDGAVSLSGYVLREGRGPIAFSVLFDHVEGKQDGARRAADRLIDLAARPSQR